jgi:hypothetical protein
MNKLKPALLGGLVVGLLSAIPLVNYCCCIWGIAGGGLATFLYIKGSPTPVRAGEGAIVGALAGIVGAVIYLIIGVPIAYFSGAAATIEDTLARSGLQLPLSGTLLIIISAFLAAIFLLVLSVLGGLIAVPIFEKRKDGMPPPPAPQDFAGVVGS